MFSSGLLTQWSYGVTYTQDPRVKRVVCSSRTVFGWSESATRPRGREVYRQAYSLSIRTCPQSRHRERRRMIEA